MDTNTYKFIGGSRDGDERVMFSMAINSEVKYPLRSFNPPRCFSDSAVKRIEQRFEIYRSEGEYTLVYSGIRSE